MTKYIALCGYPESGKTTALEFLAHAHGIKPVDDGRPLRDIAKIMFGLTEEQVSTQEGKASFVDIGGVQWQVRDILGTLGNLLENTFGELAVPNAVIRNLPQGDDLTYVFGSVRKTQGRAYKDRGGIVVEIQRDGKEAKFDFDKFDKSLVDFIISNNSDMKHLHREMSVIVAASRAVPAEVA